ncbi:hypothetical protein JMUB3935_0293 [Leptotrichia trevisanii]|uniref:MORN repeat protein n=2 Tax=Leptotrichia trevisanii TaxID=109328 RepID=A0A510KI12_9FUSO|nr:hypothetical protein JMUB3935_0293 [Leptotrichia trevisanii]
MEVQKSMIKDYKKTFLLFLFLSFPLFSVKLSEVRGIIKLSNYNELKDIETSRIEDDFDKGERRNGIVYIKGESKPFTGTQIIYGDDGLNIEGIYFFINGKTEGQAFRYYKNGQLRYRYIFRNDIREKTITYYENGVKSGELNLLKELTANRKISILDGKSLLYDKKGNLFAEMQFKNDSTVGQKQKFYENNRLKYEFIAGGEWNEPAKPSQYYIEYYDNSDKVAMHCEEKPNGSWTCKEYKKDGTFKREKDYPTVIYKQRGTKDWINYLLPVLKVFGL